MEVAWVLFFSLVLILVFLCGYVVTQFDGDAKFPADCGIVFGAAVRGGEYAGPGILRRTRTAAALYKNGQLEKIFVVGGKGSGNTESEAAVMKQVAIDNGVSSNDIIMEDESTSTWENLQNVRPLLEGCDSIIGISDRYHLARIDFLAYKQGIDLMIHPSDVNVISKVFELRNVVREAVGILYYSIVPSRFL